MSMCVALLIASEFMPVSLLTPMAAGLNASEGQTGQAISVSGLFAVIASLLMSTVAGRLNRKGVLLAMSACLLVSLVMVATASNFALLMAARALLGVCVGGFWALGTAVIMRLVPADRVSKALAVMFTGQSVAAAFAAPLGSYFGDIIGWRGVFWGLVPLTLVNLLWLSYALPSMPTAQKQSFASLWALMRERWFGRGILAVVLAFASAFSMFTYLRPFLEQHAHTTANQLSILLLVLGCCGFIGTWLGGKLSQTRLIGLLQALPVVMALVTLGLLVKPDMLPLTAMLLAVWGICNTALSIAWMAWLSRHAQHMPEAAGSIMVASIQAAILVGAALGGVLVDHFSVQTSFTTSALLGALAWLAIGFRRAIENPQYATVAITR